MIWSAFIIETVGLLPGLESSTPATESIFCASRSELRETPKRSHSSASLGSNSPMLNSPAAIILARELLAVSTALMEVPSCPT
nr:hypothetical protein [Tessaracoccus coleopterorum]